jgi:hypothetical protein
MQASGFSSCNDIHAVDNVNHAIDRGGDNLKKSFMDEPPVLSNVPRNELF